MLHTSNVRHRLNHSVFFPNCTCDTLNLTQIRKHFQVSQMSS